MNHPIRSFFNTGLYGLALAMLVANGAVQAHEEEHDTYDQVSLSASAEMEVPNDRLNAELYVQVEGEDASRLAAQVNQAMEWALAQAKQVSQVEARTEDYRTHPLYRKQTLTGWRVRQSIRLKSADTTALSELVGRLQQRLAVESVGYELSPEARQAAENQLIAQAIDSFTARAKQVAKQFGRAGYRLVRVDIMNGSVSPRPMYRAAAMAMDVERAAPRFQPGSQTVTITVNGTIELKVE